MYVDKEPSKTQWRSLYEAAIEFKKAEPWKVLYDTDFICIENPVDKTWGYCSVMGRMGEHFAIGVYLGLEGLHGLNTVLEKGETIPSHQLMHYQDCLMCSFEDRNDLTPADRKQIKDLGLTFRGKNAWPMFRRMEPGFYPWPIHAEECVYLTQAIQQVLVVVEDIKAGKVTIDKTKRQSILRYRPDNHPEHEWLSKEIELPYLNPIYHEVPLQDEPLISEIKQAGKIKNAVFQVDICYSPSPVQESRDNRPYYPRLFLLIDKESEMILDAEVFEHKKEDANVALNKLISFFLENGVPEEIHVQNDALQAILTDLCKQTDIKLKKVNHLKIMNDAVEQMGMFL